MYWLMLAQLKVKLSELAKKTGNEDCAIFNISDSDRQKILELKQQNHKKEAVKLLKNKYKMYKLDAKTYVEYL